MKLIRGSHGSTTAKLDNLDAFRCDLLRARALENRTMNLVTGIHCGVAAA